MIENVIIIIIIKKKRYSIFCTVLVFYCAAILYSKSGGFYPRLAFLILASTISYSPTTKRILLGLSTKNQYEAIMSPSPSPQMPDIYRP